MVITALQDAPSRRRPAPTDRPRLVDRRLTWRDRTWLRFATVRAAGPLVLPTADHVRAALRRLHARDPLHPMLCRIDPRRGRLVGVPDPELAAFLDEVVRDDHPGTPAELAGRLQAVAADDLPFRLVLGGTSAAIRTAHVLGDGSVTNAWFLQLLRIGDGVEGAELPSLQAGRFPLVRAVARQFVRHPDRAVRALRRSFPLSPPTPGPAVPLAGPLAVPTLVSARLSPIQLSAVRAWREAHTPDVSLAAVLMTASLRALTEHGLAVDGVCLMMDCRRYLPSGTTVVGNFATGPYLRPADVTDPRLLGRGLSEAASTGVPLVLLTALTARNLVRAGRSTRPPAPVLVPAGGPRVTLSHQGRLDLDALPWTDTGRAGAADYLTAPEPSGPTGITLTYAASSFGLHVSGTIHDGVLDASALAAALAALARDPLSLLAGPDARAAVSPAAR